MTPWVQVLIAANVIAFFLQQTLPGFSNAFIFVPALVLYKPWTIVTYMFLHGGFGHIFFNMLGLFFFGPRVEERLGSRRFIALYAVSGISGALLGFPFAYTAALWGASGAVYGVMLAFARFWPREQILFWGIVPIEIRWLVVFYAAISVFGIRTGGGTTAHFAHLGGFIGAYLYLRWLEQVQGARRFRRAAAPQVPDRTLGNWQKVDPNRVHEINREELNRILDKIGSTGLNSLTPSERTFLASFVPPDDRVPPVS